MNKDIKLLVERLFDDESELFNDELTLDDLTIAHNLNFDDYVDLGLPSGTLWCNHNVGAKNPEDFGKYFSFNDANKKYHNNLPTRELSEELKNECEWEWTNINYVTGFKVTGRNGNSIFLPAGGSPNVPYYDFLNQGIGFEGRYWELEEYGWIESEYGLNNGHMDGYELVFTIVRVISDSITDVKHQLSLRTIVNL